MIKILIQVRVAGPRGDIVLDQHLQQKGHVFCNNGTVLVHLDYGRDPLCKRTDLATNP